MTDNMRLLDLSDGVRQHFVYPVGDVDRKYVCVASNHSGSGSGSGSGSRWTVKRSIEFHCLL
jgi:hypothetical protein